MSISEEDKKFLKKTTRAFNNMSIEEDEEKWFKYFYREYKKYGMDEKFKSDTEYLINRLKRDKWFIGRFEGKIVEKDDRGDEIKESRIAIREYCIQSCKMNIKYLTKTYL